MAAEQRAYYRALYAGQIAALLGGGTKNMPQVRNLAMELRKLCNHPVSEWLWGAGGAVGRAPPQATRRA